MEIRMSTKGRRGASRDLESERESKCLDLARIFQSPSRSVPGLTQTKLSCVFPLACQPRVFSFYLADCSSFLHEKMYHRLRCLKNLLSIMKTFCVAIIAIEKNCLKCVYF